MRATQGFTCRPGGWCIWWVLWRTKTKSRLTFPWGWDNRSNQARQNDTDLGEHSCGHSGGCEVRDLGHNVHKRWCGHHPLYVASQNQPAACKGPVHEVVLSSAVEERGSRARNNLRIAHAVKDDGSLITCQKQIYIC